MTQKNWIFFFEYDAKNWTSFSWIIRKELTLIFLEQYEKNWLSFLFNNTSRIEPHFAWIIRKKLNLIFLEYDAKNWILFLEYDAKNWTLFLISLKELNLFFNVTQRIEPLYISDITQRFHPIKKWLQELNLLFQHDSKNWTF